MKTVCDSQIQRCVGKEVNVRWMIINNTNKGCFSGPAGMRGIGGVEILVEKKMFERKRLRVEHKRKFSMLVTRSKPVSRASEQHFPTKAPQIERAGETQAQRWQQQQQHHCALRCSCSCCRCCCHCHWTLLMVQAAAVWLVWHSSRVESLSGTTLRTGAQCGTEMGGAQARTSQGLCENRGTQSSGERVAPRLRARASCCSSVGAWLWLSLRQRWRTEQATEASPSAQKRRASFVHMHSSGAGCR